MNAVGTGWEPECGWEPVLSDSEPVLVGSSLENRGHGTTTRPAVYVLHGNWTEEFAQTPDAHEDFSIKGQGEPAASGKGRFFIRSSEFTVTSPALSFPHASFRSPYRAGHTCPSRAAGIPALLYIVVLFLTDAWP